MLVASTSSFAGEMDFLEPYDKLLKRHVRHITVKGMDTTAVNYYDWQTDTNHYLALDMLKASNPDNLDTREKKLSFWINAYNFLTVDLILTERETKDIRNLGGSFSSNPWRKYKWKIGAKKYNLHQIEFNILRRLNEPRINFALCKSSLGSPDLRASAYWPDGIYSQLDEQTKSFLKNIHKGLRIEKSDYTLKPNIVHVAKLFKINRADFSSGDLKRYISRYRILGDNARIIPDIDFIWALNAIPGREPYAE